MKRIKIKKKIIDYRVSTAESPDTIEIDQAKEFKPEESPESKVVRMHERSHSSYRKRRI